METIVKTEIKKYGTTNMMFSMFTKKESFNFITSNKELCEDALNDKSEKQKDSLNLLITQCESFNRSIGKLTGNYSMDYKNI